MKVTNKCSFCERSTHKESKYCIFHASAEEKTIEEFKEALRKYVDKIKKEDGDYDFKEFIFVGDIDFRKDLNIAIFKNADFKKVTFMGVAYFGEAAFEGEADFREAAFKGSAYFAEAAFKGAAYFEEAIFEGGAYFAEAIFKGDAIFVKVIFEDSSFSGAAYFEEAIFEGEADFRVAIFKGDAIFRVKSFAETVKFEKIRVLAGNKLILKVENNKTVVYFELAYLVGTYLDISLISGALIDFIDALLKNTTIEKEQIENHILQEEKKEFSKAQRVYLLLKNNFHSIGRYEDESWAFKKEKGMERKSYCHFKTIHKWLWSCFLNGIFGYGEQPGKVIVSAILVILLFASLFMIFGISNVGIEFNTSNNFLDCMYFSTITFTTLGYGDFRPLEGWGRILAGSEAFIGAFMMALFVYTFARRTGGR